MKLTITFNSVGAASPELFKDDTVVDVSDLIIHAMI